MNKDPERHGPEISDRIVAFDPVSLERLPVERAAVAAFFRERGNRRAARIVARMATDGEGMLDPDAVDALMLRVHSEIQRLSEEFLQGMRVRALLAPALDALRKTGAPPPYRVVDVGCGPGYMIRWLAQNGELGDDVELIGADYHTALIERARELARIEKLRCRFEVTNAFNMTEPAAIYMSIGVIHHFRGSGLESFFAQQANAGASAFMHFDIKSSWLAPMGAWIFHVARMREPLAHHDGVLSAIRAHPSERLLEGLRAGAPGFVPALFDEDHSPLPIFKVMHAIVGIRPDLLGPLKAALGDDVKRLEVQS